MRFLLKVIGGYLPSTSAQSISFIYISLLNLINNQIFLNNFSSFFSFQMERLIIYFGNFTFGFLFIEMRFPEAIQSAFGLLVNFLFSGEGKR